MEFLNRLYYMERIRKMGIRREGIRVWGISVWSGVYFKYTISLCRFSKSLGI